MRPRSRHPILDETRVISIRDLRRDNAFAEPGELPWVGLASPGLISMSVDRTGATVEFEHHRRPIKQRLTICWVKAGCWPARLRFKCECGRNCDLLYKGRSRYGCWRCAGGHYACQAVNSNGKRLRQRAQALRRKIGCEGNLPLVRRKDRRYGYSKTFRKTVAKIMAIEAKLPRRGRRKRGD